MLVLGSFITEEVFENQKQLDVSVEYTCRVSGEHGWSSVLIDAWLSVWGVFWSVGNEHMEDVRESVGM